MLSFKYFRVQNIPEMLICQGSQFPASHRVDSFFEILKSPSFYLGDSKVSKT